MYKEIYNFKTFTICQLYYIIYYIVNYYNFYSSFY